MSRRAVAPVIGVVLLILITVLVAAVVGTMAFGVGGQTENAPEAAITGEADGNDINLTHRSGDPLDVTELRVRVFVEGEPLNKQPQVPAYNPEGFDPPSGEFHAWATQPWKAGEDAGLTIDATENAPKPDPGDRVTVRLYANGKQVTAVRMTA